MSTTITKTKVLYLAYDGMTDPLGQSQVLSYLKELSKNNLSFHVISFEKPEVYEQRKAFVKDFIKDSDITWHPLNYTKKPPVLSTIKDNRNGWKLIEQLFKEHNFSVIHCRGYILANLALRAKKKYGAKFIFDMRGWWPDEKKESGLWGSPVYIPVYAYFKNKEKQFFKEADVAISLTHVGKRKIIELGLKKEQDIKIIPTCVNFEVFKPFNKEIRRQKRNEQNIPEDAMVFLYSGSVGANYRTDLVLKFFKELQIVNKNSVFVFLSHSDHNIIKDEIVQSKINPESCRILSCEYDEVGANLMIADVGVIMYNLGFSVIGRSPTKLGEYWASGLKCLSANGIGDLQTIVEKYKNGGVLIDDFDKAENYKKGVEEVLKIETSPEELRSYALDYFDLTAGVAKYLEIYKSLIE